MNRATLAAKHVALPLALGVASYVVLRASLPLWPAHRALWTHAPPFVRDHFADAAWGWALGGFVSVVWLGERASLRAAWVVAAAAVAAAVECLQYAHVMRGAFDVVDLVVQVGAVVAAAMLVGSAAGGTPRKRKVGGKRKWTSVPV